MSVIAKLAASEIYTTEPIAQFSLQLRPQFWCEFVSISGSLPPYRKPMPTNRSAFRWYEVYTMMRRLMLTSVPVALSELYQSTIYVPTHAHAHAHAHARFHALAHAHAPMLGYRYVRFFPRNRARVSALLQYLHFGLLVYFALANLAGGLVSAFAGCKHDAPKCRGLDWEYSHVLQYSAHGKT